MGLHDVGDNYKWEETTRSKRSAGDSYLHSRAEVEADLDACNDGLRQDALQDLHGFTVLCEHPLHNGLHPRGVSLHPQLRLDASQQLCSLHWLAAPPETAASAQQEV